MSGYSKHSDEQLMILVKQQDHAAFTELYRRYAPKVYYQLNQMLRDPEAAKDLMQDLFVVIWNKATEIRDNTKIGGYLYIAAQNSVLQYIRNGKLKNDYFNTLLTLFDEISEEYGEGEDVEVLYDLIKKEIDRLPAKMKTIFEMSRSGNLSYKAIAVQLGIAENTVRKQVSNALHLIRDNVGKHGSSGLIILALIRR